MRFHSYLSIFSVKQDEMVVFHETKTSLRPRYGVIFIFSKQHGINCNRCTSLGLNNQRKGLCIFPRISTEIYIDKQAIKERNTCTVYFP